MRERENGFSKAPLFTFQFSYYRVQGLLLGAIILESAIQFKFNLKMFDTLSSVVVAHCC